MFLQQASGTMLMDCHLIPMVNDGQTDGHSAITMAVMAVEEPQSDPGIVVGES